MFAPAGAELLLEAAQMRDENLTPSPTPSESSDKTVEAVAPTVGKLHRPCTNCRNSRVRCDRNLPCSRCTRLGVACYPPPTIKRGRPPTIHAGRPQAFQRCGAQAVPATKAALNMHPAFDARATGAHPVEALDALQMQFAAARAPLATIGGGGPATSADQPHSDALSPQTPLPSPAPQLLQPADPQVPLTPQMAAAYRWAQQMAANAAFMPVPQQLPASSAGVRPAAMPAPAAPAPVAPAPAAPAPAALETASAPAGGMRVPPARLQQLCMLEAQLPHQARQLEVLRAQLRQLGAEPAA